MAFESVRSYVQLASGLGEMTRARAMDAAQGLLSLPVADEMTRRAVQASTLADQLLEAAKANRASLLELVRHEVETALRTADVARVAELEAAKTTIAALAKELGELRASVLAGGATVVATAARRPVSGPARRPAAVSTAARRPSEAPRADTLATAAEPAVATEAAPAGVKVAAKRTTSGGRRRTATTTNATKATEKRGAGKATAKKASTGTRSARTSGETATAVKKAAATPPATAKANAKKATAKKAATTTTARKATAKKAATTTTARKATTT